jgi:hypothetical protein
MAMAGWSHPEADQLRKLLGKHDCARKLPLFEARFRDGCQSQGIPPPVIDEVWDMIRTFRGYSFCNPHSASYAQVSFESAWLKAHHPAVFFAAVITNQGDYYAPIIYLGDARRHRLVVRGPDVNSSGLALGPEGHLVAGVVQDPRPGCLPAWEGCWRPTTALLPGGSRYSSWSTWRRRGSSSSRRGQTVWKRESMITLSAAVRQVHRNRLQSFAL